MEQIKSEKAKEALRTLTLNKPNIDYCIAKNVVNGTLYRDIERIAELAEKEAEERHAKEMQELKDRYESDLILHQQQMKEVCDEMLQELIDRIINLSICDIDAPVFTHTREFRNHFDYIKKCFINKLTDHE